MLRLRAPTASVHAAPICCRNVVALLRQVESYELKDGQLILGLKNGAGSMFFNAG